MSEQNKKYQKILEELKENIKDEKELEYVNKKVAEISIIFLDIIDEISNNFENRLHELEEQQVFVEGRLRNIQSVVKNIESDIYEDEFNFDIICPYCNNEFSANVENDSQKEVQCPECHNVIELDWNEDAEDTCGHNCSCGCDDCNDDECDCDDCHCEEEHGQCDCDKHHKDEE